MWDLGADRLEFTSRMCCVTLGNSLNLSVPQLLGLETVGIVQLLTRVMVMVNDITDMPWVLSPRSTLGWMEMDMQEVSEGELLGSAHVGEGKEANWAEGHTGRPLSIKPQAVMSPTAGTHSRVVSSWGRDK